MINVRILSMAIRTFFMANLDYAATAGGVSRWGASPLSCFVCRQAPQQRRKTPPSPSVSGPTTHRARQRSRFPLRDAPAAAA